MVVGSEVVYVIGGGATAATTTPYDVAAVRLADGTLLAGSPPADVDRYLGALRADRSVRVVARVPPDEMASAVDVIGLVERLAGMHWAEAEGQARAAGALLGAYPVGT